MPEYWCILIQVLFCRWWSGTLFWKNSDKSLHGELRKVRSTIDKNLIYNWDKDVVLGDVCEKGSQLRPHIVWFGEDVPELINARDITQTADILIIIGTSMQVYPAANLIYEIIPNTPIYFIDPNPAISSNQFKNLTVIAEKATIGMEKLYELLKN